MSEPDGRASLALALGLDGDVLCPYDHSSILKGVSNRSDAAQMGDTPRLAPHRNEKKKAET